MFAVFVVIHVFVLLALIGVVLIQAGRGGGLAGTFGDTSASQALFGGRGANTFLTRATAGLGAAFFVTSMLLAFMSTSGGGNRVTKSLIQTEAEKSGAGTVAPTTGTPAGGAPGGGPGTGGGAGAPGGTAPAPATGGTPPPAPASPPK